MAAKKKTKPADDDTAEMKADDLATALAALPPEADAEPTDGTPTTAAAAPRTGGLIRSVLAKLSGDGVKVSGVGEVLALVMLVVKVIEEVGPVVEEIVARVKELWQKK
jgi:hypothetical protein